MSGPKQNETKQTITKRTLHDTWTRQPNQPRNTSIAKTWMSVLGTKKKALTRKRHERPGCRQNKRRERRRHEKGEAMQTNQSTPTATLSRADGREQSSIRERAFPTLSCSFSGSIPWQARPTLRHAHFCCNFSFQTGAGCETFLVVFRSHGATPAIE